MNQLILFYRCLSRKQNSKRAALRFQCILKLSGLDSVNVNPLVQMRFSMIVIKLQFLKTVTTILHLSSLIIYTNCSLSARLFQARLFQTIIIKLNSTLGSIYHQCFNQQYPQENNHLVVFIIQNYITLYLELVQVT